MPFYISRGNIPPKRHIQHRADDGKLYFEEHVSREGFSDIYSNLYHIHPPTRVLRYDEIIPIELTKAKDHTHRHHHLEIRHPRIHLFRCLDQYLWGLFFGKSDRGPFFGRLHQPGLLFLSDPYAHGESDQGRC